ncbi:MAG: hypothetical protein U0L45_01010 [Alistipes sp.]|nr:hypothetical protein [Alistipes sp.]
MVRISKVLEGLISQVAFDMGRAGVNTNYKDYLMIALLRSKGSLARRVVERMAEDWQIYQIIVRIERQLEEQSVPFGINSFEFFAGYMESLTAQYSVQGSRVSTINALTDILYDSSTISAEVFERYKITPQAIEEQLALLDAV